MEYTLWLMWSFVNLLNIVYGDSVDSVYFYKNDGLSDTYSNTKLISQRNGTTLLDCARRCLARPECKSLFFLEPLQSCLLNSDVFSAGSIGYTGAVYFDKQQLDNSNGGTLFTDSITTETVTITTTVHSVTSTETTGTSTETTGVESCVTKPCENHGNCVAGVCQCTPNYAGNYCEKAYSLSGCYLITLPWHAGWGDMSPLKCVEWCMADNYPYAGLQGGNHCHCGHTLSGGTQTTQCNNACSGSPLEFCGGVNQKHMYHIV